jgi:RNAse (barnase) inhibitor barstar
MDEASADFSFSDESLPGIEKGTLVVHIPATLQEEQALLDEYVQQLHFPTYFGWNWDAFNDCLGDLGWLDDSIQRVVIVHRDVPFSQDSGLRATYLSILRDRMRQSPKRSALQVVFPRSAQRFLER